MDGKIIGIITSCDLRSVANERKGCYQYAYDTVTKSIARGRDSLIKKVDCLALQRCFIERKATLFKFGEICQRSEEHTSELQSRFDLVCRLLLEKKNLSMKIYDVCILFE